jgi:hypothetical protein
MPVTPSNNNRHNDQGHTTAFYFESMTSHSHIRTQRKATDHDHNSILIQGIQTINPPTIAVSTCNMRSIFITKAPTPKHHSTPRLLYNKEIRLIDSACGVALCQALVLGGTV